MLVAFFIFFIVTFILCFFIPTLWSMNEKLYQLRSNLFNSPNYVGWQRNILFLIPALAIVLTFSTIIIVSKLSSTKLSSLFKSILISYNYRFLQVFPASFLHNNTLVHGFVVLLIKILLLVLMFFIGKKIIPIIHKNEFFSLTFRRKLSTSYCFLSALLCSLIGFTLFIFTISLILINFTPIHYPAASILTFLGVILISRICLYRNKLFRYSFTLVFFCTFMLSMYIYA